MRLVQRMFAIVEKKLFSLESRHFLSFKNVNRCLIVFIFPNIFLIFIHAMQFVRIYYGPCDSFYTVSHKPQKLRGLRANVCSKLRTLSFKTNSTLNELDHLQTLGFRVDLIPVDYVNYCVLEMCGHEVFRCNIKNLAINTYFERDPVCRRAINAVVESSEKFLRARSHRWFWALIEDQIFRRSEFAPKDHWPFGLDDDLNVTKQLFK